jgi:hypothetical protein
MQNKTLKDPEIQWKGMNEIKGASKNHSDKAWQFHNSGETQGFRSLLYNDEVVELA